MSKVVLVSGATGKQGGSVVDQLANKPPFTILAVTRNASSASAQKLARKASNIKLVQGDLNNVPALFHSAEEAAGAPIWAVFSVQISMGAAASNEVAHGTALIDAAVEAGVKHFVYTSVERGGDEASWDNGTTVPHFQTKHKIEHHLRDNAGSMGWTILRPTAFMDNLTPAFPSRVFMAALRDTLGEKELQWVATRDIGVFARLALESPDKFNHKAIGLAGEELTTAKVCSQVEETTGAYFQPTYAIFGYALKRFVHELGVMITWFGSDGYKVDIPALRKMHPDLMNFETWLKTESPFPRK